MIDDSSGLPSSLLRELTIVRPRRSRRITSYDRTGGNRDWVTIEPGQTAVLADIEGAGCVNRFYAVIRCLDQLYLRKVVIRAYWDGETTPSIEVPFGDFFGATNGKLTYFSSLVLAIYPGGYGANVADGFNCFLPMPFARRARIELENQGDLPVPNCWYHLDYEELSELAPNVGRLHAQWRRERPTRAAVQPPGHWTGKNVSGAENYVILEAAGRGSLAGFVLGVDNSSGDWWGEGDDMVFVDGETWPPSIHGTGTEEIFGAGACPNVPYAGPYMGMHQIGDALWAGKNGMYRFFVNDPVRFQQSIRVTIEHGHNNDLANDYSSVAYWYQTEPHAPFPPLPDVVARLPEMPAPYWPLAERERDVSARYFELSQRLPDQLRRQLAVHYRRPVFEAFDRQDYAAVEECLGRFEQAVAEAAAQAEGGATPGDPRAL